LESSVGAGYNDCADMNVGINKTKTEMIAFLFTFLYGIFQS
jgi:hypothetical protein